MANEKAKTEKDKKDYVRDGYYAKTLADEFPVEWSDPEDAKLTWQLETSHFHRPFPPLAVDYILSGVYYGMYKFAAESGSPLKIRGLAFNGRVYEGLANGTGDAPCTVAKMQAFDRLPPDRV